MTHQTSDYTHLIRQKGFRVTPQRQLIMDAICAGEGHTTLDEIYARVQKSAPAISLPTLYRNLNFLCDVRLVVSLQVGNKTYYEIAGTQPHHHLICRQCGAIEELRDQDAKQFFTAIHTHYHFAVDMNHLGLAGLCASCNENE